MSKIDLRLLNTQKQRVFDIIESEGVNPKDLIWSDVNSSFAKNTIVSKIKFANNQHFSFKFDRQGGAFWAIFSPGEVEREYRDQGYLWKNFEFVRTWVRAASRELSTPDPWAELSDQSRLVEATAGETDNTPFNEGERARVAEGLNELKKFIFEHEDVKGQLSDQQRTFIETQFKYLLESSERFGRKDWKHVFLAVLIQVVFGLALREDISAALFSYAKETFSWLLQSRLFFPV